MAVRSADREGLRQLFECDDEPTGKWPADFANPADIDNRPPVNTPKLIGVQFPG